MMMMRRQALLLLALSLAGRLGTCRGFSGMIASPILCRSGGAVARRGGHCNSCLQKRQQRRQEHLLAARETTEEEDLKIDRALDAALILFRTGDLEGAEAQWKIVMDIDEDRYIFQRGLCLFCQGRYADAQESFLACAQYLETIFDGTGATDERIWAAAARCMRGSPPLPPLKEKETDPFKRAAYDMLSRGLTDGIMEMEDSLPKQDEKDLLWRGFFWNFYCAIFAAADGRKEDAMGLIERALSQGHSSDDLWIVTARQWKKRQLC